MLFCALFLLTQQAGKKIRPVAEMAWHGSYSLSLAHSVTVIPQPHASCYRKHTHVEMCAAPHFLQNAFVACGVMVLDYLLDIRVVGLNLHDG